MTGPGWRGAIASAVSVGHAAMRKKLINGVRGRFVLLQIKGKREDPYGKVEEEGGFRDSSFHRPFGAGIVSSSEESAERLRSYFWEEERGRESVSRRQGHREQSRRAEKYQAAKTIRSKPWLTTFCRLTGILEEPVAD